MLVLEPKKRFTIEQIKHHRWMMVEVLESPVIRTPSSGTVGGTAGTEPNEVVLRIMANIGIDMQKTKKSLKVRVFKYFLQNKELIFVFVIGKLLRSCDCNLSFITGTIAYEIYVSRKL